MLKKDIKKSIEANSPDLIIPIREIEIEGQPIFTSELENFNNKALEAKMDTVSSEILENPDKDLDNNFNSDSIIQEEKENSDVSIALDESSSNISTSSNSKKRNLIIAIFATASAGGISVAGYNLYQDIKAEQIRLSELDKENLDLKLIINTVDDFGGKDYQLNWKDVASVLGVMTNNRPSEITKNDVEQVCALFLDKENNRVKDLKEVIDVLEIKDRYKNRIFDYSEDLIEYGYTPEKLLSTSTQMQFINSIKSSAMDSYNKTGILPSITIAQAILESSWGESNLSKESNNLFGIKADSSWKGEFVVFETKEFHDTMIKDKFRKYPTINDSIIDHSEFLRSNPRYEEGGVFNAKTYKEQALALQESGYSTAQDENGNKTYALMLEQIIRQYNLQIIDWEAKK